MIQAVIFDMDGVIVDSERHWPPIEQAFYYSLIPTLAKENYHDFVGMSVFDLYDYFVRRHALQMSRSEFLSGCEKMAEEVYLVKASLLPGFETLITKIAERKLPVGLASSSPRSWIAMMTRRFALEKLFQAVVSAEDLEGEGKPSPKVYLETARKLQVHPQYCLAIEDSKNGIASAKN